MNWTTVNSSRIRAVSYDEANQCLYIEFHSGSIYCYFNVSDSDFNAFMSAPSLGRALSSFDKVHPYRRVR